MRALKVELHVQEAVDLRLAPSDARELVDTRAGVQPPKEHLVCVVFRTKDEAIVQCCIQRRTRCQLRDGNTPTSAIQKFIARFGCMFECG
jgi:hypothetical protein